MNKTIKKIGILFVLIASIGFLASCANTGENDKGEDSPRIVSVSPSVTELIYAFGKEDQLVGRSDYCDYPSETEDIPSVGSLLDPNVEMIIELEPDILFISAYFKDEIAKTLEEAGIESTVILDAEDFEGSFDVINEVGEMLDAKSEAEELVTKLKGEIEEIQEKTSGQEQPTVYYVVGFGKNGDFTATGDTYIAEILKAAGGTNIAQDASDWMFSIEKIIEEDPEYIIISENYGMKEEFVQTEGYKELSAVKNNKVIEVDDDLLNRQGPRLAQGVESIAKILHPDLFN